MKTTNERHFIDSDIISDEQNYNHLMHLATYQFALKFVKDKSVLDYGCGSGYGTYSLTKVAKYVTGVDISKETIEYCRNSYSANNLLFRTLPDLSDEKYDIIISFQVIEHVFNIKGYLEKIKILLKPGGSLLISTPDKTNRLFKYIQRPWNVYHIKEYSGSSLSNLLNKYFTKVDLLKIGSKSDFVIKEIIRTKKQRIITLPCTLFFYPNFVRVFLLNFQVTLFRIIRPPKRYEAPTAKINFKEEYSIQDIEISKVVVLSTDLFAICSK